MDEDILRDHLHKLINKVVSTQSLIILLSRTELNDKQSQLVEKSQAAINELVAEVKVMREKMRKEN